MELITFWHGHAGRTVTDSYSKLKDDVEFRKQVVEKVGLGFELPSEKPRCWTEWTETRSWTS